MKKIQIKLKIFKVTFYIVTDCTIDEAMADFNIVNDLDTPLWWFCIKKPWCWPFIYINNSQDIPLAIHEIYHWVYRTLESMRIDDEETIAYTLEFVVKEYFKKLDIKLKSV